MRPESSRRGGRLSDAHSSPSPAGPDTSPVSYTHLDVYKRQVRGSLFMALLSPNGSVPLGKKSVVLTVYNVFRRLLGGPGVFLPEVFPGKEDRGAPFQDAVIDTRCV